ncbi:isoleucyl-tRNA synthetase [Daedalea quercina L-15889]|uniref:Isoleucine--tRNA ligase, mitochondrial n=1 Tax=Daedalea quercina L-15889 TaxID=1314783 RepID=A0A165R9H5_9APHY|nr:isoleucyl-tRNA synthetase [Daedalea quercina L-15889]
MKTSLKSGFTARNASSKHRLKRTIYRHFSGTTPTHSPGRKSTISKDVSAYTDSLLLPQTSFISQVNKSTYERLREKTCDVLYREQWKQVNKPLFVLHDGPPYANGDLHIGHALNKILKDIINRYHVLIGHRVHYIPGWDCHGLPIENKALQKLRKSAEDLLPRAIRAEAESFAREEVTKQQEQFRQFGIMADWSPESTYRTLDHDYEMRQLDIFKTMVEEGLIYRQLRPVYYSPSSRTALAEGELTYNEKHSSYTVYVAFELDPNSPNMSAALRALVNGRRKVRLLVWTTTPWTLTANMGIAVNPEMMYKAAATSDHPASPVDIFAIERETALAECLGDAISKIPIAEFQGSDLVGATYRPLFSTFDDDAEHAKPLPIVPSSHVTSKTGTGLVHCAPAHGDEDYNVFRSLGLLSSSSSNTSLGGLLCHVDITGCFSEGVAGVVGPKAAKDLVGQEVLTSGGKAIVGLLEKAGALRKLQRIRHSYPYDWRTDQPVIVIATSQWFANTDRIKGDALAAIQSISSHPAGSHSRLEIDVRNRSEWCISRQRAWGVPIPALYHIPSGRAVLDGESLSHILSILREMRTSYWWEGPVVEFVPPSLHDGMDDKQLEETWRKGTDTMDVWFDSGSSWSMLEGLYADGAESVTGRRFGADVCLEGRDQHRGWFQSQLLTAVATAPNAQRKQQAPYTTLITHGMTLDAKGRKMSKSLGNVISPMTIINGGESKAQIPYYPDVLRLWTASVKFTEDMSIGHDALQHCRSLYLKIRLTARYILGALRDQPCSDKLERDGLGVLDGYVMHELHKLEDTALKSYASYDFARVVASVWQFVNGMLSPVYVDTGKDCLYADAKESSERRAMVAVLAQVLDTMTSIVAPILPYLAEEIYETLHNGNGSSVFMKKWSPLSGQWVDPEVEWKMGHLLHVRTQVLSALEEARQAKHLRRSPEADVVLTLPADVPPAARDVVNLIQNEVKTIEKLCIVSSVSVGAQPSEAGPWQYTRTLTLPGCDKTAVITMHPATLHKCPRCWLHTSAEDGALCHRCSTVVS